MRNSDSGEPVIAGSPVDPDQVKIAYSSYSTDVANGGVDPDSRFERLSEDFAEP